jgi:nitroreductase
MEINKAILNRRSIRGFKPEPVPRKVLEELLGTCRWAPSAQNTQTCEMAVLGGKVMAELKSRIEEKVKANVKAYADIASKELYDPYLQRANEQRDSVDIHQFPPGTKDLDAKRRAYLLKGARLFDAPNAIIIYTDRALDNKTLINAGVMVQTIALGAVAHGLGTCIMLRAVHYPDILRELFGIPESKLIIIALAIGYPDPDFPVNNYPRHRVPLDAIAKWHGF